MATSEGSDGRAAKRGDNYEYRLASFVDELGEPAETFAGRAGGHVAIHAFDREFENGPSGFVLVTNGMSDQRMSVPDSALKAGTPARAELMWHVRKPTPEIVRNLRWLAELPFIDTTWFGFAHRVPMPWLPLKDCAFKTFLFLTPIVAHDKRIAEALSIDGNAVELLTVNLISDAEYEFIKQGGLDRFLEMLDENFFDPKRKSYL